MRKALDPQQDLRRYQDEAQRGGDVASRQRYADELVRHGRADEAIAVYRQALTGLYEADPNLLLGLAQAQFASGACSEARATLEQLRARNPQFHSPDAHLLYARALEGEGNVARALEEYAAVTRITPAPRRRCATRSCYAPAASSEQARHVLKELLEHARSAPRHYRRMQREWLVTAERELSDAGLSPHGAWRARLLLRDAMQVAAAEQDLARRHADDASLREHAPQHRARRARRCAHRAAA